jgi:endonuclease YncB( thermonuclease family)
MAKKRSYPRRSRKRSNAILMLPVLLLAMAAAAWLGIDTVESSHAEAETPAKPKVENASVESSSGKGSSVTGTASVIDGDTLDIHGERIRLVGVDAPESKQNCKSADGQLERCGQKAANALDTWIDRNPVTCAIEGKDRYQRLLGQCSVRGTSVQEWLVANGHALAYRSYSKQYVPAEDKARAEKVGVWAGDFIEPWDWRKGVRLEGEKPTKSAQSSARTSG